VANEPGLQRYMAGQIMALVMNRHWDAILKDETGPPSDCYAAPFTVTGCHIIRSIWRWARGMARAERGELADAHKEYGSMADEMRQIVPPTPTRWGNNSAAAVLAIPRSLLKARILWAEGKNDEAIAHLKLAVTHEDALVYDEPPQWFPPAREALGGAYLQLADCEAAASIFNAELGRHRESGRALYGLMRALKRAGMSYDEVEKRFIKAWHADHKLDESRLWPPRKAGAAATGGKWPCQPIPESD
jgi:tetratricopeptide (TPR) repeat protein